MPLIVVNTSLTLEKEQKDAIKSEMGKAITIIPGKTEQVLMVDVSDGRTIYFHGEEPKQAAHVDVHIYGSANFAVKSEFTQAIYKVLNDTVGLKDDEVFVTINEHSVWGAKGKLK